MEKLKKLLAEFKNTRILDIATGRGSFIEIIMQLSDNYSKIIGIDNSPKAIETAVQGIIEPRVSFAQMDVNEMTFEKHSFDIVCLSNSMHHMTDINECIKQMCEMVKPEGILLFNEMISDNIEEKQMTHTYIHHFWAEINRLNGVIHNETMKKQEIIDIFKNNKKVKIDSFWELKSEEENEISQEETEWLKGTLVKSLEAIKDHPDYQRLKVKAKQLEERIDGIGFKAATQMVFIIKPD